MLAYVIGQKAKRRIAKIPNASHALFVLLNVLVPKPLIFALIANRQEDWTWRDLKTRCQGLIYMTEMKAALVTLDELGGRYFGHKVALSLAALAGAAYANRN
ncbi:MAG: hypothetical protein ACYC1L_19380 [Alphaproteobacteria bacterium]